MPRTKDQEKKLAEALKAFANSDIELLESGNFADATIVCGEKTWKVHKAILASRSQWFRKAFSSNFEEGKKGVVTFPENDPEEIGWLLRYLYAKDMNIRALADARGFPALCVKLWRLGDYFLVETLTAKVERHLGAYLDGLLLAICDNNERRWAPRHPKLVSELLLAVKEAYRDDSADAMREMLVSFFWATRYSGLLRIKKVMDVMDEKPAFGKDLLNILVRRKDSFASPQSQPPMEYAMAAPY